MSSPVRLMSVMLLIPPSIARVEVIVHRSQMVLGTSVELACTEQAGVLVGVAVKVAVGVKVGVKVGPGVMVTHGALLRMSRPQALRVPTSWAALSVTVNVHTPLALWLLKVESGLAGR